MSEINYYEVVKKLVGSIEPIGETNADERRFNNLKATCDLVDKLITDIDSIYILHRNSHEFSVKRSVEYVSKFLDGLGIEK